MAGYEYTLPTTGAFFFSPSSTTTSTSTSRQTDLRDGVRAADILARANNHRAQLRDTLKTLKRSDGKDTLGVVRVVEDYLPLLYHIASDSRAATSRNDDDDVDKEGDDEHDDDDENHRRGTARVVGAAQSTQSKVMVTSWRSTFFESKVPGKPSPRLDLVGIEAEMTFVLLTYAYALSNYASLPSHPPQKVVELLCRASGVFDHVHAEWSTKSRAANRTGKPCPELYPELAATLAKLAMGEAQMAAIKQVREKASPPMLCRFAVAAADHFSTAQGIVSSHPLLKTIPSEFRSHLTQRQSVATSRAFHYLALEQAKAGHVGFAVGCAQQAERLFKDTQSITLLRELTKENQQVTFQAVAGKEEVQARLPSGRDFVKVTRFVPPALYPHGDCTADRYAGESGYY